MPSVEPKGAQGEWATLTHLVGNMDRALYPQYAKILDALTDQHMNSHSPEEREWIAAAIQVIIAAKMVAAEIEKKSGYDALQDRALILWAILTAKRQEDEPEPPNTESRKSN